MKIWEIYDNVCLPLLVLKFWRLPVEGQLY